MVLQKIDDFFSLNVIEMHHNSWTSVSGIASIWRKSKAAIACTVTLSDHIISHSNFWWNHGEVQGLNLAYFSLLCVNSSGFQLARLKLFFFIFWLNICPVFIISFPVVILPGIFIIVTSVIPLNIFQSITQFILLSPPRINTITLSSVKAQWPRIVPMKYK